MFRMDWAEVVLWLGLAALLVVFLSGSRGCVIESERIQACARNPATCEHVMKEAQS